VNAISFINSKDIAVYLKKIYYNFNTLETSWLIYNSINHTIHDKITAWQKVISTMPDCMVEKRFNCKRIDSWHKFLKEYIKLLEKTIQDFKRKDNDWVYGFGIRYQNEGFSDYWDYLFSNYDKCLACVQKQIKEDADIYEFRIAKIHLDKTNEYMTAYYRRDSSLIQIDSNELNDLKFTSFEGLWFDFPTPFKKGDIIYDPRNSELGCCSGPFVVESINIDPAQYRKLYEHLAASGDSSDMNARGYFLNDDGSLYYEVMHNYMNCEYYRKPLTGIYRTLKTMSSYLRGKISEELMLLAYHRILMEEKTKQIVLTGYTNEGLRFAGLK
jgi:hypothetical protein